MLVGKPWNVLAPTFSSPALQEQPMIPVGATDVASLRQAVGSLRWVPGFAAWVGETPGGQMLYLDRRELPAAQWPAVWKAAFGTTVPTGYRLVSLDAALSGESEGGNTFFVGAGGGGVFFHQGEWLVVIAIISVLIGLLVPAVRGG